MRLSRPSNSLTRRSLPYPVAPPWKGCREVAFRALPKRSPGEA